LVNLRCRKRSVAEFMQESNACTMSSTRRKESSRSHGSLSHLLPNEFLVFYTISVSSLV